MLDSLYGNLLGASGPAPLVAAQPAAETSSPVVPEATGGSATDDIFAEPKDAVQPAAAQPQQQQDQQQQQQQQSPQPQPQLSPPQQATKAEPSNAPLPQSFSAAKLMMPPVRKKAEPVGNKRPGLQALDIQKLQEEKEALMRQRAAAEKKDDKADAPGDDEHVPAMASTAPVSGTTTATSSLYGDPDEEYDPAKPNDYDEFCRRRMRQKAEEEMERRRQETLARQQAGSKPPEPKEDDFATRMLKKMGWKEGSGLGKDNQGMATPLVMKKTDQRTGTIVEGGKREAPAQATPQPDPKKAKAPSFNRPPTKVLLLNNLVGAGEVDEDLEGETAEEAGKYGKLVKCVVKEIKGKPDEEAVRIFLQYEKSEDATKALVDMNGRYFGGRVVKARFYDEDKFAKGDLDAQV